MANRYRTCTSPILASLAGTAFAIHARNPLSGGRPPPSEKYQDCVRDARGDVFAERTGEIHSNAAKPPR